MIITKSKQCGCLIDVNRGYESNIIFTIIVICGFGIFVIIAFCIIVNKHLSRNTNQNNHDNPSPS